MYRHTIRLQITKIKNEGIHLTINAFSIKEKLNYAGFTFFCLLRPNTPKPNNPLKNIQAAAGSGTGEETAPISAAILVKLTLDAAPVKLNRYDPALVIKSHNSNDSTLSPKPGIGTLESSIRDCVGAIPFKVMFE